MEPIRTRLRVGPRPPHGPAGTRRRLLWAALVSACLCAASLRLPPAFAVGSGTDCSLRGSHVPLRCAVARAAGGLNLADLQVGQTVEGTVAKHVRFGAFVDVGADREGLVMDEELSDGLPMAKLKKGTTVTARVLKNEDGKLWLTLRSGDLARPKHYAGGIWKDVDLSPFVGVPEDQWFDGEVQGILLGKGAWIMLEVPGTDKLARGLLKVEELAEGMIDNIHRGTKVRVRVLACDVEKSQLTITAKDP